MNVDESLQMAVWATRPQTLEQMLSKNMNLLNTFRVYALTISEKLDYTFVRDKRKIATPKSVYVIYNIQKLLL